MIFRMTLTFKTWYFRDVSTEDFEGEFEGYLMGLQGCLKGIPKRTSEGTLHKTWKGAYWQAKVRYRSGLVQV